MTNERARWAAVQRIIKKHKLAEAGRSMFAWAAGFHTDGTPHGIKLSTTERAGLLHPFGTDLVEEYVRFTRAEVELRAPAGKRPGKLTVAKAEARLRAAERTL